MDDAAAQEYRTQADGAVANDHGEHMRLWSLARAHQRHAEDHRAAAEVLRESEDPAACVGVPYDVTAACPLSAYPVAEYAETQDGLSVVYVGADPTALSQHIRCHVAHAAMASDEHPAAASCPLIGDVAVSVEAHPDGALLRIHAESPEAFERLRGLYEADDDHAAHGHD